MTTLQPRVSDLDAATLRRLAQFRAPRGRVLSVYVDLDPATFATPQARASEITSLLTEAEHRASREPLEADDARELELDIDRVREFLEESPPVQGAGALALFSCAPEGFFEVVRVPEPVPQAVDVAPTPNVEPLAEHLRDDRWCVLLVNRRTARFLRGSAASLREVSRLEDDVHGRHKQGGWSAARFERSVDEDAERHFARVDRVLRTTLERAPFDHLLIAAPEETSAAVRASLLPAVGELIAGTVTLDVEHASVNDVSDIAREAMDEVERDAERRMLDRLAEAVGTGNGGRLGAEAVFTALIERRVGTLLVAGTRGWGEAIELALGQAADVRVVRHYKDLDAHDGIGAILRF